MAPVPPTPSRRDLVRWDEKPEMFIVEIPETETNSFTRHLGPITSAHQGPVFWETSPSLFSTSTGVSADCQPLWLVFYIHASVVHSIFQFKRWPWCFFGSRIFSPNWVWIELDLEEACLYEEYWLPCDLQDPGARNSSPIRREIDHPNRCVHSSPNITA